MTATPLRQVYQKSSWRRLFLIQVVKAAQILKYAQAYNGKSRSGSGTYVERYAVLTQGLSPRDPNWVNKVQLFDTYHDQIAEAFSKPYYSVSQDYA